MVHTGFDTLKKNNAWLAYQILITLLNRNFTALIRAIETNNNPECISRRRSNS
jgi:hypothetical protein